jgi:hypothetical protein
MPGLFNDSLWESHPDVYAALGIDPRELQGQQIGAALQQLGLGLLSGRNWGQGIALGAAGAAQGYRDARRNAIDDRLRDLEAQGHIEGQNERAEKRRRQRAFSAELMKQPPVGAFDPSLLQYLEPEQAFDIWQQAMAPMEPPTVRDFYEGGRIEQRQWDPSSGKWTTIGSGPRWQPPQGAADAGAWEVIDLPGVGKVQRNKRSGKVEGLPESGNGLTPTQQANNAEIDAARNYLKSSGLTMDDIAKRTEPLGANGLENPNYDPYIMTTLRLAMSRKVGDDPDFDGIQQQFRGAAGSTGASSKSSVVGTQDNPLVPMSQADIDNAPSGTVFRGPDGKLYVKP